MEGYKKHKCIYCDYTSDRAHNVRIHAERKQPENSSTQIDEGTGKYEVQPGMEMEDQLINTMRGSTEDKHTQWGGGIEERTVLVLHKSLKLDHLCSIKIVDL